jgi:hypothetical protein
MSEMSDLKARVDWLERRLAAVPVRFGKQAELPTILEVQGGNTIFTLGASTFTGILQNGTISSVPTAVPVAATTYANGLGYGYVLDPAGAVSSGLVWICNGTAVSNLGVSFSSSIFFPIPKFIPISSVTRVTVTCATGGTATVYIPSRIG